MTKPDSVISSQVSLHPIPVFRSSFSAEQAQKYLRGVNDKGRHVILFNPFLHPIFSSGEDGFAEFTDIILW